MIEYITQYVVFFLTKSFHKHVVTTCYFSLKENGADNIRNHTCSNRLVKKMLSVLPN